MNYVSVVHHMQNDFNCSTSNQGKVSDRLFSVDVKQRLLAVGYRHVTVSQPTGSKCEYSEITGRQFHSTMGPTECS